MSGLIGTIKNNVIENTKKIWKPKLDIDMHKACPKHYGDISESRKHRTHCGISELKTDKLEECSYKSKKIILDLTKKQKKIVNGWLYGYKEVYNNTIKYIKINYPKKDFKLNWMDIRNQTKEFKSAISKKFKVKVHDLDYAIKLACQNYSAAFTNMFSGLIKHFRIRYWRNQRKTQVMDLEKQDFKNGTIRENILGQVIGYYNSALFDMNTIKCDCRLQYNSQFKEYYLLVPEKVEQQTIVGRSKFVSLDPGIRTFMTGITPNKVVEIGNNIGNKIRGYLKRLDRVKANENISDKLKKKIEMRCYRKITNHVDELHWKTINYLTKNYDTILIGNMSSKGIVSNKSSNLGKMTKRVAMHLRFYEFRERLKYKCSVSNTGYKLIDERYTSKMCSNCGEINNELGSSKIFKCGGCKMKMDRDVNGSRGILLKGIK